MISEIEVYSLERINESCYQGFVKSDGQKVVLKPEENFIDKKVIHYLSNLQMAGVPRVLGFYNYLGEKWIVHSWQEGQAIIKVRNDANTIEKKILQIKKIILTLNQITGLYWFFLDLKPEHILCHKEQIHLIDFEHVTLSENNDIDWKELGEIGISNGFCSPDLHKQSLTLNHQDYALAMIALALLTGKNPTAINKRLQRKAISAFTETFQKEMKNAINMQGFSFYPQSLENKKNHEVWRSKQNVSNTKIAEKKNQENVSKINCEDSNVSQDPKLQANSFANYFLGKFRNMQIDQNFTNGLTEERIMQLAFRFFSTYLDTNRIRFKQTHRFFRIENKITDSKKEFIILKNYSLRTISPVNFMPVFHEMFIVFNHGNFNHDEEETLLRTLAQLQNNLLSSDLLTNFIASHIVNQYAASDVFVDNQYIKMSDIDFWPQNQHQKSSYQFKKGVFAENLKLCHQMREDLQ